MTTRRPGFDFPHLQRLLAQLCTVLLIEVTRLVVAHIIMIGEHSVAGNFASGISSRLRSTSYRIRLAESSIEIARRRSSANFDTGTNRSPSKSSSPFNTYIVPPNFPSALRRAASWGVLAGCISSMSSVTATPVASLVVHLQHYAA